jgi:hypothetical protein
MSVRRAITSLALLIGVALQAAPSAALTFAPTVTIGRAGGTTWDMLDPLVASSTLSEPDANGVQTWTFDSFLPGTGPTSYTVDSWTVELKEDPFVTNNLVVTNTSGVTGTFVATVLLPITPFAYDTVINSSVGVTVTDSNGNGTLLYDVSGATPIYDGFVSPAGTLLAMNPVAPGTLPITTADCLPFSFPGCTATSSNGVASLAVAPGVASAIGITLTFQLSAGDSAGMTSRFEITNVPEPTTAALLGVALLGLVAARRRTH